MSITSTTSMQLPSAILIAGPAPKESRGELDRGDYDLHGVKIFNENVRDLETLEEFQKEHPNLNISGRCGWTPLACAIDKRCLPVIDALLDKDPSLINKRWGDTNMPPYLCHAAGCGPFDAVKTFLRRGAKINITCGEGWTPLNSASHQGNRTITKYLLLRGAVLYQKPLLNLLNDPSWANSEKAKVVYQIELINELIKEIKAEYEGAHKGFERIVFPRTITKTPDGKKVESEPQKTIFSKLPSHLMRHVMSFSSEPFHLRKQFVERVKASTATKVEPTPKASKDKVE